MKTGDYVRIIRVNRTYIRKIMSTYKNLFILDKAFDGSRYEISREKIIESSSDILDLIHPGDLIYIDICPDEYEGIPVYRVLETLEDVELRKEDIRKGKAILKGIITREQLSTVLYEVDNTDSIKNHCKKRKKNTRVK